MTAAVPAPDPYDSLTPRERQVVALAAHGNTNPEIGERLLISARTSEIHRCHAMRKLGLRGQTELVRYAIAHCLVPCPCPKCGKGRSVKR